MTKRRALAVALLALFAVHSEKGRGQLPAPEGYVLTIRERVPGRLFGTRDAQTTPVLEINTTKVYGCPLPLMVTSQVSDNRIRLTIDGIGRVEICPAAIAPASATVELEVPAGSFTLDIVAGQRVDHYSIRLTDSLITVAPRAGAFSSFTLLAFHRAPRNSLAFNCMLPLARTGPVMTQTVVCPEFAQILIDSLKAHEFSFGSGPGWPFQPAGEQQPAVRYFRYSEPEDFGRAYDLLQNYSRRTMSRVAPNAQLILENWRGVRISSYLCRPEQSQWCTDFLLRPRW